MNNIKILELFIQSIPNPSDIKNIDLSEKGAIRINWRCIDFRISSSCGTFAIGMSRDNYISTTSNETTVLIRHLMDNEKSGRLIK